MQLCPPACSPPADGQAFHPDFICLAAWKAPIQLVHEMGCSSSISAPFLIRLITFDLDKIPLPPQEGQMTLCGSGCVPKDSIWLQAVHCTYPQCGRERRCPSGHLVFPAVRDFIYLSPFEDQVWCWAGLEQLECPQSPRAHPHPNSQGDFAPWEAHP